MFMNEKVQQYYVERLPGVHLLFRICSLNRLHTDCASERVLIRMNHEQACAPSSANCVLHLIYNHLVHHGFTESASTLLAECADNSMIDRQSDSYNDELIKAYEMYNAKKHSLKHLKNTHEYETAIKTIQMVCEKEANAVQNSDIVIHTQEATLSACGWWENGKKIVMGGADKKIVIKDIKTQHTEMINVQAPVISMAIHGEKNTAIVGMMNGTHAIIALDTMEMDTEHRHKKWVVDVAFNQDGTKYATGSHDKTVNIYQKRNANKYEHIFEKVYEREVESIVWWKETLIVSLREDNYLHYLEPIDDGALYVDRFVNMNELKDDHVSFTVLHMALSPTGDMLACTTDRHRVIVFATGSESQVRNFYDLQNDGYALPRVCFDNSGRFLYATSQPHIIVVFDMVNGKKIKELRGHKMTVRDIASSVDQNGKSLLVSVGFDKTARLWSA